MTKETNENYERYILESFDFTGYELPEIKSDKEKLETFKKIFISEYGHEINRLGFISALTEYLQGLPSCINIDFYNYDILQRAKLFKALPLNPTIKQEDKLLSNYFVYMASRINVLLSKNFID